MPALCFACGRHNDFRRSCNAFRQQYGVAKGSRDKSTASALTTPPCQRCTGQRGLAPADQPLKPPDLLLDLCQHSQCIDWRGLPGRSRPRKVPLARNAPRRRVLLQAAHMHLPGR